ncbi:hypothetical protein D3C76_1130390 [compost metagenome]
MQGLAVRPYIGARDAFKGDHQQIASASGGAQQFLAMQVGLGQAGTGQGRDGLLLASPGERPSLQVVDACGQ